VDLVFKFASCCPSLLRFYSCSPPCPSSGPLFYGFPSSTHSFLPGASAGALPSPEIPAHATTISGDNFIFIHWSPLCANLAGSTAPSTTDAFMCGPSALV
jgi:hypothetical protein